MATATAPSPLKFYSAGKNIWRCESGQNNYKITEVNGQYQCSCPARVECRHIKELKSTNAYVLPTIDNVAEKPKTKGFRRSILEILKDFQEPIPQRFIKTKTLKGQRIEFVSWYSYVKLLDFYAPGFGWEIRTKQIGDRTIVEGRLTILAEEGDFVREATGQEDQDTDSWGDPSSNAEAMALRRCCAKFGLGLHLWTK